MITKWKVSNFKSIQEDTELALGPLTIFAGANSSGKSTFIQSILLIAQTLSHKVGSRSVVLNGSLTSLGQFNDLKSSGLNSEMIKVKCTCAPLNDGQTTTNFRGLSSPNSPLHYGSLSSQIQEVSCEITFDADSSSTQAELLQIQPRLFESRISCKSIDEDREINESFVNIIHTKKSTSDKSSIDPRIIMSDEFKEGFSYGVEFDSNSMSESKEEFISAKPVGCILKHFLPEKIIYSIDIAEEFANAIITIINGGWRRNYPSRRVINSNIEIPKFVFDEIKNITNIDIESIIEGSFRQASLFGSDSTKITLGKFGGILNDINSEKVSEMRELLRNSDNFYDRILNTARVLKHFESDAVAFIPSRPPRLIGEAALYLDNFFTSCIKYLGPLRDAPKPLYPLAAASDPYDVGLRGEHTASILDLHKNKKISYMPSGQFRLQSISKIFSTVTLEAAVVDWLQYLGVADSVESQDKGKLGHELKVRLSNSECPHDLTHVGVGVSQVLPILVMCLLSEKDSTLVFEQPELHLHPKVQTLLGDFFLSMTLSGKQCIVETHSEYLIDRLRYRIASSQDNDLNKQTKIYFVEKPYGTSSFNEVLINEFGAISDWPDGFFDQSQLLAEQILLAASKKRNKKSDDNNV